MMPDPNRKCEECGEPVKDGALYGKGQFCTKHGSICKNVLTEEMYFPLDRARPVEEVKEGQLIIHFITDDKVAERLKKYKTEGILHSMNCIICGEELNKEKLKGFTEHEGKIGLYCQKITCTLELHKQERKKLNTTLILKERSKPFSVKALRKEEDGYILRGVELKDGTRVFLIEGHKDTRLSMHFPKDRFHEIFAAQKGDKDKEYLSFGLNHDEYANLMFLLKTEPEEFDRKFQEQREKQAKVKA